MEKGKVLFSKIEHKNIVLIDYVFYFKNKLWVEFLLADVNKFEKNNNYVKKYNNVVKKVDKKYIKI